MDQLAENDAYLKTNWSKYRRPTIKRVTGSDSNQYIEIEPNAVDANTSKIIFPDGDLRTVTETRLTWSGGNAVYVAFRNHGGGGETLSLVATHNAGLLSSNPVVSAQWGFVYAVKTTDDATKFVIAGCTIPPIQSNFATLNTRFGTDGWVYLGAYKMGETSGSTTTILDFRQSGNMSVFLAPYATTNIAIQTSGYAVAFGAASASLTWTYAAGTSGVTVPANFTHLCLASLADTDASNLMTIRDAGGVRSYGGGWTEGNEHLMLHWVPAAEGLQILADATDDLEIALVGWIDGALGVGVNPVL